MGAGLAGPPLGRRRRLFVSGVGVDPVPSQQGERTTVDSRQPPSLPICIWFSAWQRWWQVPVKDVWVSEEAKRGTDDNGGGKQ